MNLKIREFCLDSLMRVLYKSIDLFHSMRTLNKMNQLTILGYKNLPSYCKRNTRFRIKNIRYLVVLLPKTHPDCQFFCFKKIILSAVKYLKYDQIIEILIKPCSIILLLRSISKSYQLIIFYKYQQLLKYQGLKLYKTFNIIKSFLGVIVLAGVMNQ